MTDGQEAVPAVIRSAPASPLLNDPEWLEGFKKALRSYLEAARELSRNHALPGYPAWSQFEHVGVTFVSLRTHLLKISEHNRELHRQGPVVVSTRREIMQSYQWACLLLDDSALNDALSSLTEWNQAALNPSQFPSPAELEAAEAILDSLSQLPTSNSEPTLWPVFGTSDCPKKEEPPPSKDSPLMQRVFHYGVDEIRRFAADTESALKALSELPERLEIWGDNLILGDRIKNNLEIVVDQIRPFLDLVHHAHSLGMPFQFNERLLVAPKTEIESLFGSPPDMTLAKSHNQIFVDLYNCLFWIALAINFKAHGSAQLANAEFPAPSQMRRLRDVVARLGNLRDRVDATFNVNAIAAKPKWDRETRTLTFGGIVCRKFKRMAANQIGILEKFEAEGWPATIPNPLKSPEQMIQATKDFNEQVEPGSPFRLSPNNLRVAWKPGYQPASTDLP